MPTPADRSRFGRVLFGAAYYAEYHRADRLAQDLDLMVEAGFSVIRVGESVWSTWEPRDGEFDLEWLAPVLDGAHQRGIAVVLGTPTYAVPPWLAQAHPEIAGERRTGEPIPWGARQEIDYTHPAFLFHAERVIRAILRRYADHPAVVGYQVDNEPGLELFHNHATFTRFVRRLAQRYGDVATLNQEWGLTYWSHRIDDWSQLWRPDGNTFPQYDLAWRRYQADLTTEFIAWQADLVEQHRRPEQFVTTCLQYTRPGLDDELVSVRLDVTSGNPYYGMQERLDAGRELPPLDHWTTSGVAGLFRQGDRMFSSRQERFLVTETNAQGIGASDTNYPPYPGQLRQAAYALISRGAAMIEYWHWHTLPHGAETYWGGILPHSLVPGRVYAELSELGAELAQIGDTLEGYEPDADVALLWSNPSRYALQFMPPFRDGTGAADPAAYEVIVDAFHRGVVDSGHQARILHLAQAHAVGAAQLVARYPVLVAAGLYITSDADLDLLVAYAELGGHLILGVRTGYADEEARVRVAVAPDRLTAAAGVRYEESSNLDEDVAVMEPAGTAPAGTASTGTGLSGTGLSGTGSAGTGPTIAGSARRWIDGLILDGARSLADYDHPHFAAFPAVTSHRHGAGQVTVVGCVPSPELAAAVLSWAAPDPVASRLAEVSLPVTVSSGLLPDGRRVWFAFNWGWATQEITLTRDVTDTVTGKPHGAQTTVALDRWSTRTFVDQ